MKNKMKIIFKCLFFSTFTLISVIPRSTLIVNAASAATQKNGLPSFYDGRDYGYVTGVRDQNAQYDNSMICWAQSAISSAEMNYIIKQNSRGNKINPKTINWNPYHFVYYAYNPPSDPLNLFGGDYTEIGGGKNELSQGGIYTLPISAFANWIGPSSSTKMTATTILNDTYKNNTQHAFSTAAHMENAYVFQMASWLSELHDKDDFKDVDSFYNNMKVAKQMIMKHGSICIGYNSNATVENGYWKNNAYQYADKSNSPNHAVCIIGWDDTISASKFGKTPQGAGAWLVKNSVGEDFGQNGYFWLSYYDMTIQNQAVAYDFASSNNYDNNYQYDGSLDYKYRFIEENSSQICAANAYVADSYETLKAVGFYTLSGNQDYEIQIYRKLSATAIPSSGTLVHTQKGNHQYEGFHTIVLNNSIDIDKDERYAVVVTIKDKNSNKVCFSADRPKERIAMYNGSYSFAKQFQSYSGKNVKELRDLNPRNAKNSPGINVRIKAYTNEREGTSKDSNNNLYYYTDGKVDASKTGVYKFNNSSYYFKNGKVDTSFDGVAKDSAGTYWYIENGVVDFSKYGTLKRSGKIYFFTGGRVDTSKTGLFQYGNSWYYIKNGNHQSSFDGIYKSTSGVTYYIEDGKVDFSKTGVYARAGVKYYFKEGKLQSSFDGVAKDSSGNTWYIENGKVDTGKTGVYTRGGVKYYFKSGKVQSSYDGVQKDSSGNSWYIENGKVDTGKTGVYERGGCKYYFKSGKLQSSFDGVASDKNGTTYYIENGKVDYARYGVLKRGDKYYYFSGGIVQKVTRVIKIDSKNSWYIKNGVADFNFTGIASDANGTKWYVYKGKVNTSFNGVYTYNGVHYKVVNGKATRM